MKFNQQNIKKLAADFRLALERLDRKDWGVSGEWCGGSSGMDGICDLAHRTLAKIIEDRFGVSPNVVPGDKNCAGQSRSHVWLEIGDLIVDVTGCERGVVVTKDRALYDEWDVDEVEVRPADFSCDWWNLYCGQAYQDVSRHLDRVADRT